MPQLPLKDVHWHAFADELDCVTMPELVWRYASPDCALVLQTSKMFADCGGGHGATDGRAPYDAEARTGRELLAEIGPGLELAPCPRIHSDDPSATALARANRDGATGWVEIAFLKRERFVDP